MQNEDQEFVQRCPICTRDRQPQRELLIPTPLPDYPWQVIGSDLFQVKNDHYLLTADYFSRYPEVTKLTSTTPAAVIVALKRQFARFGIPEIVRSDNGPQYDSAEFADFAKEYGFTNQTSSSGFPQSNGFVERIVKTVKKLLQQSDDPCLALLTFRSTPLPWCNLIPAELLMGRRLCTQLPQIPQHLKPTWSYLTQLRKKDKRFKETQKRNFDRHHRAKELQDLPDGQTVWITSGATPAKGTVFSV